METAVFLERFKELVHVYEELGGEPGASTTRIQTKLNDIAANKNNPTNAELKQAKEKARDEYLGVLFLLKSDRSRFGQLVLDIENDFTRNVKNDGYPADLTSAYNTLISFCTSTGRPSIRRRRQQESASYFTEEASVVDSTPGRGRGRGGRGRGRGRGRGGRGQAAQQVHIQGVEQDEM